MRGYLLIVRLYAESSQNCKFFFKLVNHDRFCTDHDRKLAEVSSDIFSQFLLHPHNKLGENTVE